MAVRKQIKYMLIGSQFKLSQINSDLTVKVNNTPLERVIKHKSLGVQIDESLNWRPHINAVTAGILTSGRTPLFIRSMRTGPRHWRARGHREIT